MNKVSVMFDAPARSGNHLAVATLSDSFPSIKFYWGYPRQHSPKSFFLPKEKAKHILTVLRNPLDSITSLLIVFNIQTNEAILSNIDDNKKMLQSMLDNINNIHIASFEDLTNNTAKYISDVSKILETTPVDLDYNDIKNKLQDYYLNGFYVSPIDNQIQKDNARELLVSNYKKEVDECIDLYKSLQQYVIQ
jgi:hypothetical protein